MFCKIVPRIHLPLTTTQIIPVEKDKNILPKTTKIPITTSKKTTTALPPITKRTTVTTTTRTTTTLKAIEPSRSTITPDATQHLLYSDHQAGNSLEVSEEIQTQMEESLVVSSNKNSQEDTSISINQLSKAENDFLEMNNDLGLRMYRDLLKTESFSNLIFSPFSAITFIATIFLGSRGSTFRQVAIPPTFYEQLVCA